MKRMLGLLILVGCVGVIAWKCYAASVATVTVTTTITPQWNLSYWGEKDYVNGTDGHWIGMDPASIPNITTLPFGTLIQDSGPYAFFKPNPNSVAFNGTKADSFYYALHFSASTSGTPYKVTASCSSLSNGAKDLNKSFIMTPIWSNNDTYGVSVNNATQGAKPSTITLGQHVLIGGQPEQLVYSSSDGTGGIVQAALGFSTGNNATEPAGAQSINATQASGTYVGVMTFTLETN